MTLRILDMSIPDGSVRVERRGDGPALLFLHGVSANRRIWHEVAPRLEDRFTLYLPDLLSRGESEPRPDVSYGLECEVARLLQLVEGLRPGPLVAVGHSQGAALAVALAAEDPRVRGLVLANPVTPWTPRPPVLGLLQFAPIRSLAARLGRPLRRPLARWILARTYGPERRPTGRDVARYAGPYADPARARALLRVLADWRPVELATRLPRRRLPALVLAGEADRRIGVAGPAALADALGASFHSLPGAGHILPEERPAAVAGAISDIHERIETDSKRSAV